MGNYQVNNCFVRYGKNYVEVYHNLRCISLKVKIYQCHGDMRWGIGKKNNIEIAQNALTQTYTLKTCIKKAVMRPKNLLKTIYKTKQKS